MIETVTLHVLQQEATAAVGSQAFTDQRGVLGVPTSPDGLTWAGNWDITAISQALEEAATITWHGQDLRVRGRYELRARHFRVAMPSEFGACALRACALPSLSALSGSVLASGSDRAVVWEVLSPDGQVLVRSGIDLAEDIYHHSPPGSHLYPVVASAGLPLKRAA